MPENLDAIISRLQNMHAWNVYEVLTDENKAEVKPWYEVTGGIVNDLVIKDANLQEQVQALPGQIMQWGRLAAQCKRVWEIVERQYRIWRDTKMLGLLSPPDPKPKDWKKPTEKLAEATMRSDPQYKVWYKHQERAEEAYNAAMAVLDGFRAKKELMKAAVIRKNENAAPMLSV